MLPLSNLQLLCVISAAAASGLSSRPAAAPPGMAESWRRACCRAKMGVGINGSKYCIKEASRCLTRALCLALLWQFPAGFAGGGSLQERSE